MLLKMESEGRGAAGANEGVIGAARSTAGMMGAGEAGEMARSDCLGNKTGAVWGAGLKGATDDLTGTWRAMGIEANNDWAKTAVSKDLLQGMFRAAAAC